MRTESRFNEAPGFWWIGLLAASWFGAGFIGPMIFVPDSNIGPIIGILISGPLGLVAGVILFVAFRFIPLRAGVQWLLLGLFSVIGVAATLLFTQPEPKALGTMVEVEVKAVRPVSRAAPEIMAHWRKRVAETTWAAPRAGWEDSMETALAADSREVLDVVLLRERIVQITRKPWDRGNLVATPWFTRNESLSYLPLPGALPPNLAPGTRLHLFLPGLDGHPHPTNIWPPVEQPVPYAAARALPAEYQRFR